MPTTKGLNRRNVAINSNCPLCGYGEDSNAHAVFRCPFAQDVWVHFDFPLLEVPKEEILFKGVLLYVTEIATGELLEKVLIIM